MLKAVEIKNFRSCHSTRLDFEGTVCALSGRNGVGKSNILRAIEWASRSVITADGIRLGAAGSPPDEVDELSIKFRIRLAERIYDYELCVPWLGRRFRIPPPPLRGLQERLRVIGESGTEEMVFEREDETISLTGRAEEIRIPLSTPALAALFSLLAVDDPRHDHIERLISFFSGVRYYSLHDRPDAPDYVTEQAYEEWKFRYQTEGALTPSVAFRLIYMWQEEQELFEELLFILGPDGLGVVEEIEVIPVERLDPQGASKGVATSNIKIFVPRLRPSQHMGGAGRSFTLSSLSVGTRRVVRIIASMLFDRRSLMMLEQPEDSIHPGLLRKLIDQLRTYSSSTQMLFTTHSLEVLDILHPEEILLTTAAQGATNVRRLTPDEIQRAKEFLKTEGSLSDFLEPLDDL